MPSESNRITKTLVREESSFFVEGGIEECPPRISSLDRTLVIRVENTNFVGTELAIILGFPGQAQPPGVLVSMPDIGDLGQEILRRDILANQIIIEGMRMIFATPLGAGFAEQRFMPMQLVEQSTTGHLESNIFQTTNGYSPTNTNQPMLDFPLFGMCASADMFINYPIIAGQVVFFYFTEKKRINYSNVLFDKSIIEQSIDPRQTGNPLFDLLEQKEAEDILKSGFSSVVNQFVFCPSEKCQTLCSAPGDASPSEESENNPENGYNDTSYSFCPRPTGNPIADTQLFKDDNCI